MTASPAPLRWTLLGYFPKRLATRSGWVSPYPEHPEATFPAPEPIDEICSVSPCISRGLESISDPALQNLYGGFRDAGSAWNEVPYERRSQFRLFAYRIGNILFVDGQQEPLELIPLDVEPLPRSFERLGYDAVMFEFCSLGCSPLSCNGQTYLASVNTYCLVNTDEEAICLARQFSINKPEPGPYAVVEVWGRRQTEWELPTH
jgi:hypothetical protein